MGGTGTGLGSVARTVAVRPRLWGVALRQLRALTPPGRRLGPDPAYARFRSLTQYGDEEHRFEPGHVVAYLEWCRRFSRAAGRSA